MESRMALIFLFGLVLLLMIGVTLYASMERSIFDAAVLVIDNRWFQATLADAYLGFVTFFVWVAYKESCTWQRVLWFALIMTLGNIAMSVYVLIQLWRWDPHNGVEHLLLRKAINK